ncbi:MAG: ThiF family adenylyltransferase [Flavobacteriales bacterium]|nr:ThiF family adenylyltransferase [Flavobacteriales bacterium]
MSNNFIPELIRDSEDGAERLSELKELGATITDLTESQINELKKIRLGAEVTNELRVCYVFYPWLNAAYKILEEKGFIEVRTGRNRYKITLEEQELLATKKIGIVGLSVGRTIATTLAAERSCGELRVADFDILELSNLNRIKAPLHHIGMLKAVSLAREIKEFDPYFNIHCFDDGITPDNIDSFFLDGGKLDILVDECDSLEVKIKLRKKARELGIPVIMDTSDRGLVDIERFDLEPNRPFFHGKIGDFNPPSDWKITDQERQELFLKIIDLEKVSERGKYSLFEIGKTISTWPQLSSDVVTGGGVSAQICRKILLGNNAPSGRYYFDVDSWLNDG